MRYAKKRAQTPAYTIISNGIAHLDRQAWQCNIKGAGRYRTMEHVSLNKPIDLNSAPVCMHVS